MKMMNTPGTIFKRDRDGGVAYWVVMPGGVEWNIWDLAQDEATASVESALCSAFERGMDYARMSLSDSIDASRRKMVVDANVKVKP